MVLIVGICKCMVLLIKLDALPFLAIMNLVRPLYMIPICPWSFRASLS
jgi:hypothetical protein